MEDLRTQRLTLVALTPHLARAALRSREELGRLLGARVPEVWPGADFARMLPRIAGGSEKGSGAGPTRLIVWGAEGILVGETGFHAPPDGSGTVEVGYSVVPGYRGRGIAPEATRALIEHAFAGGAVRRVVAGCLQDNAASRRVLEKLGMRLAGSYGEVLCYELSL